MSASRTTRALLSLGLLAAACATSEEDPQRRPPGGFADAAGGSSGSSGTGGNGGQLDAASDSSGDASRDVSADGPADASGDADAAGDSGTTGQVVIVSRSSTGIVLSTRGVAGPFSTKTVATSILDRPALAETAAGAVLVVRDSVQNELRFATWNASTGALSALSPVGTAGLTLGSPALATASSTTLAFLGSDFKYYVNRYGGSWQGFAPVLGGGVHSFGPSAPSVAALPNQESVAYIGDDGNLYTQLSQGSSFQAAFGHSSGAAADKTVSPAITARQGAGQQFVAVYTHATTKQLYWTQGSGTSWSAPALVTGSIASVGTPALAALSGGDVLLAFRGSDDRLRTTILSGSTWSAPQSPFPASALAAAPAVARGLDGRAEVAWVSGGTLLASSLNASGWKPAVTVVASAQQAVAITTYKP